MGLDELAYGDPETLSLDPYWRKTTTFPERLKEMYKRLPSLDSGKILDIGCSTGEVTEEIATTYPHCDVLGIDINNDAVVKAQTRGGNATYEFGNGYKSRFADNAFDMVFCNNNIYYVMQDIRQCDAFVAFMPNINRLVKPRGYLAIAGEWRRKHGKRYYDHIIVQKNRDGTFRHISSITVGSAAKRIKLYFSNDFFRKRDAKRT